MAKLTIKKLQEAAEALKGQTTTYTMKTPPFEGDEITFRALPRRMMKVWRQSLFEGDPDSMEMLVSMFVADPVLTPADVALLNEQSDEALSEIIAAGTAWLGLRKLTPEEKKAAEEASATAAAAF